MAKFSHCCCCLPLHVGHFILGIFMWVSAIAGIISLVGWLILRSDSQLLTIDMLPGLLEPIFTLVCAVHFAQASRDPTAEKKMRWAKSFLISNLVAVWIGYYLTFLII